MSGRIVEGPRERPRRRGPFRLHKVRPDSEGINILTDAGVHYSVVEAIAQGERRWSRIASRVGKQTSALVRPLEWFLDMEVVERVAPVTEYPRGLAEDAAARVRAGEAIHIPIEALYEEGEG